VAVHLKNGEWLAEYQHCEDRSDCRLQTSRYVAEALAGGRARVYDDVAVYERGRLALYAFKVGGHVVLVDRDSQDEWQDYVGMLGMDISDLEEYICGRYDEEVCSWASEALKSAKALFKGV